MLVEHGHAIVSFFERMLDAYGEDQAKTLFTEGTPDP